MAMTALALCAVSFFAGIAGDLAAAPPSRSGVSVVLAIPPDVPRAGPLPALATPVAAAVEVAYVAPRRPRATALDVVIPREKPRTLMASSEPKENPDLAPKAEEAPPVLMAELKA
ncbi:hypothetical protein U91I_01974 [alpha proteobacterium U9-1i]|nr:hypothetical protein U91I_01974 [alpha proteobacterium U9-1i]